MHTTDATERTIPCPGCCLDSAGCVVRLPDRTFYVYAVLLPHSLTGGSTRPRLLVAACYLPARTLLPLPFALLYGLRLICTTLPVVYGSHRYGCYYLRTFAFDTHLPFGTLQLRPDVLEHHATNITPHYYLHPFILNCSRYYHFGLRLVAVYAGSPTPHGCCSTHYHLPDG